MAPLLTIADLARQTGLEEAELRFYESEHSGELPAKVLVGGRLLFVPEAVAAFKAIHARHAGAAAVALPQPRVARVLAVTSGKGGVGKTSLALNLAVEWQRQGRMTVLLDADMGMANVHLLCGLRPERSLADVLAGRCGLAEIIAEGPEGIGVVAGGTGVLALADSSRPERFALLRELDTLARQADAIIIDTGAGMGRQVRDFLFACDQLLFVLTPEVTSLADAYGLLKALHQEGLGGGKVFSVVNMADSLRQAAEAASRFAACAGRFLDRQVTSCGYVLRDASVSLAVAERVPFTLLRPQTRAAVNARQVALALLQQEDGSVRLHSSFARYHRLLTERLAALAAPATGVAP
ncbi:MAG: AAA family ATPase [Thermodesulfobacteriota bacterium]